MIQSGLTVHWDRPPAPETFEPMPSVSATLQLTA